MGASGSTADLILHPVRLRVIQALLGGRTLTTTQIAAGLPDVSTATLYRHVATLVDAGLLEVVAEQRVRGAVERTYALRAAVAPDVPDEDLRAMSAGDHKQAFAAFVAALLAAFDRYVDAGGGDLARDGVGYRQRALWLSDGELAALLAEMRGAVERVADNGPAPGRRRRLLATVLVPDPPEGADDGEG